MGDEVIYNFVKGILVSITVYEDLIGESWWRDCEITEVI